MDDGELVFPPRLATERERDGCYGPRLVCDSPRERQRRDRCESYKRRPFLKTPHTAVRNSVRTESAFGDRGGRDGTCPV